MSRLIRLERARVFIGCEGESESGYVACLTSLTRDRDLPVTLDPHIMDKGDPLSRIRWAEARIKDQVRKRGPYAHQFAFLDTDQRDLDPARGRQAEDLAARLGIRLVWQEPDHEGLLLLHFNHEEKRHPRNKAESMRAIRKVWPNYEKGSTGKQYGRKLFEDHLKRASERHDGLKDFLITLGLPLP
ncbi:hypothetical protein PQU94_06140 [Asticcacaulis sp. DXS10W]|uniref:RloB-like protein n=1 Tax=Asticcacaulis currens TaxID=2984210 RepID=A0ABT5ICE2_9CAUL|nr:RloB domain-containing protein [Asticcacaulis currens]MDC7693860.1 hypothetical protein [Asticcacaulis currens]